jgi:hypothetical protein
VQVRIGRGARNLPPAGGLRSRAVRRRAARNTRGGSQLLPSYRIGQLRGATAHLEALWRAARDGDPSLAWSGRNSTCTTSLTSITTLITVLRVWGARRGLGPRLQRFLGMTVSPWVKGGAEA